MKKNWSFCTSEAKKHMRGMGGGRLSPIMEAQMNKKANEAMNGTGGDHDPVTA